MQIHWCATKAGLKGGDALGILPFTNFCQQRILHDQESPSRTPFACTA